MEVLLGGALDYLFPARGDDPCGSLWILAQRLCSLWVDAHPPNSSRIFPLYPEPSASGIPIGFPAVGKGQGDELLWKSYFREGEKALTLSLFSCNVICGTDIRGNAGAVLHSQLLEMGFCRLGWL